MWDSTMSIDGENFKEKKSLPTGNLSNQLKTYKWRYNFFKDGSAWLYIPCFVKIIVYDLESRK